MWLLDSGPRMRVRSPSSRAESYGVDCEELRFVEPEETIEVERVKASGWRRPWKRWRLLTI